MKPPAGARQPARSGVGHLLYRPGESVDSQSDVGGGDRLRRVMADAPGNGQTAWPMASARRWRWRHALRRSAASANAPAPPSPPRPAPPAGDCRRRWRRCDNTSAAKRSWRRPAMACASPSSSSSSAVSGASCGPRISSVNCTSPGITFTAPGAQRRVPTVATGYRRAAGSGFPPAPSIPPPRRGRPCDGASAPCRHGQLRR